jgi:hypothetical protein
MDDVKNILYSLGTEIMMNIHEYQRKYRRFVQGLISEEDFKRYLTLTLSKTDLTHIIISSAKSLRRAVAIGEPLGLEC